MAKITKLDRPDYRARLEPLFLKVGAGIRIARLRRRWTEKEMASRAGLSLPTYRRIERGNASGSLESFGMVLVVLGLEQLIGELAAPERDIIGMSADTPRLPKRVVRSRRVNQTANAPLPFSGAALGSPTVESLGLPQRARKPRPKGGEEHAEDQGSAW